MKNYIAVRSDPVFLYESGIAVLAVHVIQNMLYVLCQVSYILTSWHAAGVKSCITGTHQEISQTKFINEWSYEIMHD